MPERGVPSSARAASENSGFSISFGPVSEADVGGVVLAVRNEELLSPRELHFAGFPGKKEGGWLLPCAAAGFQTVAALADFKLSSFLF